MFAYRNFVRYLRSRYPTPYYGALTIPNNIFRRELGQYLHITHEDTYTAIGEMKMIGLIQLGKDNVRIVSLLD